MHELMLQYRKMKFCKVRMTMPSRILASSLLLTKGIARICPTWQEHCDTEQREFEQHKVYLAKTCRKSNLEH